MNKKIPLGAILTISIFGMAHGETTDLNAIIGTVVADDYTYDSSTMTFSVDYGSAGIITGRAQCSAQVGKDALMNTGGEVTISATLPNNKGAYCYCALDAYTNPVGGNKQDVSSSWVCVASYYTGDPLYDPEICAEDCTSACAGNLSFSYSASLWVRTLMFDAVETPIIVPSTILCNAGYYLPAGTTECALCPANSYCTGGEYEKSETVDSGIVQCQSGLIAPAGMWQPEQCGRALHVGDAVLYLRQTKQTEHALHIQSGDNIFYGNATTADVPMNINTNHRLKVLYNDVIYSIYDDTIKLDSH